MEMGLQQAQQEFVLRPNNWSNGAGTALCTLHRHYRQDLCLSYLCKIKRKLTHQYSAVTVLSTGFQSSYTVICKRTKRSRFCFQMKSYTNLRNPWADTKQRVAELQLKNALDALLKPVNTWEASPDPVLVSAAGTCSHAKDKTTGTSRGPFQHHPPQQPQTQAAKELPSMQGYLPAQSWGSLKGTLEISELGKHSG